MRRLTGRWVRKAEDDLIGARELAQSRPPLHELICFHCQQSAEKYLKAVLEERGIAIPKTHNLDDLGNLLAPHHAALSALRRGLIFLTDFAVGTRYPGKNATKRQAHAALRWATRVRQACRAALGVPPPRRRKSA